MMIDTSPWSSCSSQSPWLPCSGHTISSTGPSVSPLRDFFSSICPTFVMMVLFSLSATMYGYYTLPSFGFAVLKNVAACDQTLDFSSSVVRVGEYDLSKDRDCFDFPPDDCADEVQVQFSSPSSLSL